MENGSACEGEVLKMVTDVFNLAIDLANAEDDPMGAVTSVIKTAQTFDFPVCNSS